MRKPVIAAAISILLGAGAALGATVSFNTPTYKLPNPSGVESYSKQSPTSGTLTFVAGQSEMQIGGTSTISTLTIALNPKPYDGQMNCFYTKPIVTTLTLSATSPQTLNDAVTATTATTRYCYLFSAGNNSWDRIQ